MPVTTHETPVARLTPGVRILLVAIFATSFGTRSMVVALGLQVFAMTGEELHLGLLGLFEFAPLFFTAPFAGTFADRFDRRRVYAVGLGLEVAAAAGFVLYIRTDPSRIWPIFLLVILFGFARSLAAPASRALPVDLAPKGSVERVVALRSVTFQSAGIIGPVVAGLLFTVGPELPFALAIVMFAIALALLILVPKSQIAQLRSPAGGRQMVNDAVDGIRFIRRTPVLMGAISLDLFAVLFGGAVALLPAIGEKRLGVDEAAVGFLYSAIGVGALITASILSIRPIRRHVGKVLLSVVAVFGVATIALGLTTSYAVAFVALMVLSAADAISVFIRATLVPLVSPENMRGRVLAVENVFIGGSNEIGALESGLAAWAIGLVGAVVTGGVATLGVVLVWWKFFPALRDVDRFEDLRPTDPAPDILRT